MKEESRLKIIFIFLFVLGYFSGGIFFMVHSFNFLLSIPLAGPILIERIFYIYFFIMFIMLSFSSLIISVSGVFSSSETEFLMLLPVPVTKVLFTKFIEVCFLSNWAFIFLSVPVYIAFGIVKQLTLLSYLLSAVIIIIPFVLICSSLGFILSILIFRFLWNMKGKLILTGFFSLLVLKVIFLWKNREPVISNDMSVVINRLLEHTNLSLHPYLPSTWVTNLFFSVSGIRIEQFNLYMNLVFSLCFLLIALLFIVNHFFGYSAWSEYRSKGQKHKAFSLFRIFYYLISKTRLFSGNTIAIIAKDIQLFFRDPVQYLQFGIFFGLILIYILNLKHSRYDINTPFWKNMIIYLNLGSVCLTLATLFTRFLFPQISLEGKSIWIIGLSPLKKRKIIYTKYFYSVFLAVLITLTLTVVSNSMLSVTGYTYYLTIGIALLSAMTLSAFSIGFGAIFPDFTAMNAVAIVSGFGGTLTLIVSIIYVTVFSMVPGIIGHLGITGFLSEGLIFRFHVIYFCFNVIVSTLLTCFILKKGIISLENYEF